MGVVSIVFIILCSIIALLYFVATTWQEVIRRRIRRNEFKKVDINVKAGELARINLDSAGLSDVEVVKGISNKFKYRQNKVVLKKRVYEKNTVSGIAIAMQQVAKAIVYNTDKQKYRVKMFIKGLFEFVSVIFAVGAIILVVVELIAEKAPVIALILLGIGILFYILSLVWSIKLLKQQKAINTIAMGIINNMGVFSEEELAKINKIFSAFNTQYILDAVLSIAYLIAFIFRAVVFILKIASKAGNN